ncbi:MAG: ion transporter [Lachnospiraceae bacterium]
MKKRIFDIIQIGNREDMPSRVFDIFIVVTIILNVVVMFLETFDELSSLQTLFTVVEVLTILIFCVEYALRIWTADYLYPGVGKLKAKFKFLVSFDGIVDLCTILPVFFLSGFIAFRMLRVVRILHLFRINAQYDSFNVITTDLKEKKNQIISSVFIIMIPMFASSLGMYSAEHDAQPEVFENAFSGIWWSVSTMLTVGYGDLYPITIVGRVMAIFIAFLGVGVVAIPTGIISAGFVEQYTKKAQSQSKLCDIDEIGEILVEAGSEFCDRTVKEIVEAQDMAVLVIIRDDMTIIAAGELVVKENDVLIVKSDKIVKKA